MTVMVIVLSAVTTLHRLIGCSRTLWATAIYVSISDFTLTLSELQYLFRQDTVKQAFSPSGGKTPVLP